MTATLESTHEGGKCPCQGCGVTFTAWEVRTTVARPSRAASSSDPSMHVEVLKAVAPEARAASVELPLLDKYQASHPSVANGSFWTAFQVGPGAGIVHEHVFGLDSEADRTFAAKMGKVGHELCSLPDAKIKGDAHVLALTDMLNAAAKEPPSLFAFMWALSTGNTSLPAAPESADQRRILGTYTAFHILLNVAHREHTAPLQTFMARVVETSGATENGRRMLVKLCLTTRAPAD